MSAQTAREAREKCTNELFMRYLKTRKSGKTALVFEGQQCSAYYIPLIHRNYDISNCYQFFLNGREHVLKFKNLKNKNHKTKNDKNLYFIDKDYIQPNFEDDIFPEDVYITEKYSIENYFIDDNILKNYIRSNFCIMDFSECSEEDVDTLMSNLIILYKSKLNDYIEKTRRLQEIIYICRINQIECHPGSDCKFLISLETISEDLKIKVKISNDEEIFGKLKIKTENFSKILDATQTKENFAQLEPLSEWRGKYHIFFIMKFMEYLIELRKKGQFPFKVKRNPTCQINSNNIISSLIAVANIPDSLKNFLEKHTASHIPHKI